MNVPKVECWHPQRAHGKWNQEVLFCVPTVLVRLQNMKCNFVDFAYELHALIFAFKTGMLHNIKWMVKFV
jgi:hypothetical protein